MPAKAKKGNPFYHNQKGITTYHAFVMHPDNLVHLSKMRWIVFAHKGRKCRQCGIEGTVVVHWQEFVNPTDHYDLAAYTPEGQLVMMTLDHHIPRSFGGPKTLANLNPMCYPCNQRKKNAIPVGAIQG